MTGGLLRQRDFRRLWTADLLSQVGDRISVLAVLLLIGTDLGRFAPYASLPLAATFGVLSLWHLFAVVALAGVLAVFFEVGHQTFLPT
ncbi:hypothetical protein [Amycolatopsis sp. GM8]|uniref:hypothetical protein n=1 Tax=Amycolatopsis sp. GM8 TaxID=2896530 RepID=UPI001F366388|nr:hypothetical protein [Amycolatopsis sp. GM8]